MKKELKILILITTSIILLLFIYKIKLQNEYFGIPTNHERPFVNIYDDNHKQLKIIFLSHPFTRENSWQQYNDYKKDNFLILGITSYNEFPKITTNKLDSLNNPNDKAWKYDYMKVVNGWLHCFRNPDKYINPSIPKALISESDFTNFDTYKPDSKIKKIYDYIYVCPKDSDGNCFGWAAENKNWKLALKCIEVLSGKQNLKGLLIGRKKCKLPKKCKNLLKTTDFLSQKELIESYCKSKFILIPNKTDASPRVLTEALCCNLPALVNYNIVGGWKYINNKNGALFKNLAEVEKGSEYIINNLNILNPRNEFIDNYGNKNSGKRLKEFIQENFSDKIDVSHCKYLQL
jgi:glycosyltransferase involved in cell wall biosynthesis